MTARLLCHKRMQPDWSGRSQQLLRLPGTTVCRYLCGEKEVARAEVWKDEDVVFNKWRIRLVSGQQEKIIKGGSPKKVFEFVRGFADRIQCTSNAPRKRREGLPY